MSLKSYTLQSLVAFECVEGRFLPLPKCADSDPRSGIQKPDMECELRFPI
jgi:hypothetical protein